MIYLVKLINNPYTKYWVIDDTYGASRGAGTIDEAIRYYNTRTFSLTGYGNYYTIVGNNVYREKGALDGYILVSCNDLSDINSTNYPEYFI